MVDPQPLISPIGDSYRLEKDTSFFVWAILACAGAIGMGFPPVAFMLLPFAFVFTKLNPYRFLVLWIASTLFFLETYRSNLLFLSSSDALPILYASLLILFALPKGFRFRVPMNAAFVPLYLLIALVLALTPRSLLLYPKLYVAFDVKMISLMAFIPVLIALEGSRRAPKKVFLLLGVVILFSTLHSLEMIATFLLSGGKRPFTWTAIFISNSIVFSVILLQLPLAKRTRWLLWIAIFTCVIGVLVIQTRSIWGSTLFCLGWLFLGNLLRMRGKMIGFVTRMGLLVLVGLVALNLVFTVLLGYSLQAFISRRFFDVEWIVLLDPYSSMGYRLHEGWSVWDERTFWGHGPGATINLFFTQLDKSDFIDWWSIHSGYLEILHKCGFVGLFLYAAMGFALFFKARGLLRRGKKWEIAAGSAAMLMLVNHSIASLSSNEFTRPNSPVMWFLVFYITYTLGGRKRRGRAGTPAASKG